MTKAELLRTLDAAIKFEEKAVPQLQKKCLDCFRRMKESEMIEADQKKIRQMLGELVSDAEGHRQALQALVKKIEESEKNEF